MRAKKAGRESSWNDIIEILEDNLVLCMMVLHEEYGFGDKRLTSFIEAVRAKAKQFNQWEHDDVMEIKTDSERKQYHKQIREITKMNAREILPVDIYESMFCQSVTCEESRREVKARNKARERKEHISIAKAAEMQNNLLAAKAWAMDNSAYREVVKK